MVGMEFLESILGHNLSYSVVLSTLILYSSFPWQEMHQFGKKNQNIAIGVSRGEESTVLFGGEFAKTVQKYFAANDNSQPIILMFFIEQLILQFGKTRKYMEWILLMYN